MRTSSSAPPLMANPFVRTAGQLMFTWSLVGIELETLTSYDRLKLGSKKLEVYQALMQHVARDNSGLSLARRKDATCFLRWIMSMMSDSTILACHQRASGSKTMEKRVSTIILNVYQSTGIEKEDGSRLSLENHRKLDEVRRFSNKKFKEEHDVHRNLASSEQYSRLSEKGEYQYVSGVMGIAYNPFLASEAGGAHRNHEVAELLKFWTERIMEIDAVEKEGPSLGLILEKTPEVISIPRSNKRVEVNVGGGNGLLTTNLGVIWKLLRPHASLIEETTERVRLAPTEDEDLAKLSVLHKLITPQMQEPSERTSDPGSAKKLEPGSCLDSTCGNGEHICDGRSCVRILSFQKEDLVTWFEDITEREKSEVQITAECYARTTVNIATALGFFSRMCGLQALERLESEHHLVTALSVESWPGVLQVTQKHIRSWKVGLEAEMGFPMSEAYGLPLNAKSLIGSMMANLCGSHYPLHMAMVEVSSQRILVDKAFSVPKCVRLARMSHHSHKLLRKIKGTVPKELRDDLSEIWGEDLLKLERENTSDHERQNVIGKPVGSTPNLEDNDTMHEKMMELEPLLEASGERNLRSIEISHGECPCHCLAQTVWYPDHKNLCLVWDVEEIRSIGLPDHRQKVTLLVVSTMLALRWIEENITKYREATTPTAESIYAIDYSRRLELFETACKVFAIPTEVRHVWSRLRYFPWFRATLTSWLYMTTKDHMRKHQKEYRQFQAIMEIDAVEKEGPSLGLILEKTPEVISIPRSNKRVEVNVGGGNGLLTTNLGVIWKLLRPHASLIEETTERVRLAPTEDEDLAKLSVLHKLITPQMQEPSERTSDPGSAKKLEPGSCLDSTCGNGEHICDGRSCVRILSFQKEDLVTWFEDITEREKSEVQITAECYARTTVNIATALGFFSRMCGLQALERLESEHHLVTALSVESWPGVLQVTQKHIRSWKVGLEAEMGFPMSEAYGLPLNAKSLIGSMMANLCGSHYPLHMAMVEVSSQRILVDKAFSVPKCVRLARMSHHSHKLLRKIKGTVPKELRDDLSEIWGEDLLKLERENTSDHERQNVIGKPVGSTPNLEDNDTMHEKMMELEPLLEASGERNLRSIEISHGECPCHCLAQTVWYPDHKNLCLVWDVEEIRSIGLPDHRQKVTLLVVSTMLALRWIEENITKYREATTPTAESIYAIDYSRRLELFETACKVFAIPTEVRHVWSRLRYFPWFRATLTSWLYMTTKDHMRKHQKEYRQFQAEIGPEAFKRPLLTHRNAITTGWKRVGKMSRDNTKARESILEEDLAKNVSLSLHNSFCLNREARVKALPNQAKRLQEQREWMRSYEQLKAWEEIVISSDDEEELLRQFAASSTSGCSTSKAKSTR